MQDFEKGGAHLQVKSLFKKGSITSPPESDFKILLYNRPSSGGGTGREVSLLNEKKLKIRGRIGPFLMWFT